MKGRLVVGIVVVAAAASTVGALGTGLIGPGAPASAGAADGASATPLKTVAIERRTLEVDDEYDGSLGYEGSIEVLGNLRGTVTLLPEVGTTLGIGDRLVELDGGAASAVVLLGRRPAWRVLEPGIDDGLDIEQLEQNLVDLGLFEGLTPDQSWDDDTSTAVDAFQELVDLPVDGSLELGEVVFLADEIRVTETVARPGASVGPNQVILRGTWTSRSITVDLPASEQDRLPEGTAVRIELPDGTVVPGTVTAVGRVATAPSDTPGAASEPTIEVVIRPDDPEATGDLDSAPVTVRVVADVRADVLTVPVGALLALLEGGYGVQVVEDGGASRYVGVDVGLFQDGWVEIRGDGLEAGTQVAVP